MNSLLIRGQQGPRESRADRGGRGLSSNCMAFHLDAPLGIDPCVDIVFLWLFGAEEHEAIRVDFLNAVLAPDMRVVRARVVNPVHPGSFEGQAGIRLDIQVSDEHGRTFQIEMQRQRHRGLDQRMLYGGRGSTASSSRARRNTTSSVRW